MNNSILYHPEKSLEAILNDCSIDAIIAVDADKKIIAWNTMAEKIYGKVKNEVTGKCLLDIIPSIKNDEESLKAISTAEKGIKAFVPASKKYFHRMHVENHFIPLKDEDEIKGVMILVHDVAHRIKAEEQLQQLNEELEKRVKQLKITSDELASFTYITSNKIKEPIRQIYTGIEHLIVTEASKLSNNGKASFRRLQSSINRMDLLLDDILSVSQISILQSPDQLVDIKEVISLVIAGLQKKLEERNVSIDIENTCIIKGHKKYLQVLFYNLIDNAIKFNENEKPVININCKKVSLPNTISFTEQDYYCITVGDNGIGISEADYERIFIMFEKLNDNAYKGSGTGLTVSKKIMDAHEGFITVQSEADKGSSFKCYFPLID